MNMIYSFYERLIRDKSNSTLKQVKEELAKIIKGFTE